MTSKREQALAGLFLCLKDNVTGLSVLRNEPLPTKVPAEGLLILRDGDPGEPEVTLSPTRYHYQHRAEVEALVQHGDSAQRDTALDILLETVAQALDGQTSLGGLVDYLHIETPDFLSETVEGAPTIKAAVVPIILEYSTSNPLN
jgi:hypothetical protein